MDFKQNFTWKNNHFNVQCTPERYYDAWPEGTDFKSRWKSGTQIIKGIIGEAEQANKNVRAFGGSWSLSDIVPTPGYLINTKPLKAIKVTFDNTHVAAGVDPNMLILAQCGTSVQEMNQALQDRGKALPTSGASDGQTFIGAMSTGTHGAAVNFGSVQDYAMGLHIITSSNEDVWVEGDQKVLSDSYLAELIPGARRINSDSVFNAAIVSFGNFGFIHGVLARCEPLYLLAIYQKHADWNLVKKCLNGPSNFESIGMKPNPFHVEVIINPFSHAEAIVMLMYKLPADTEPTIPKPQPGAGPSADVLGFVSHISNAIPVIIPEAMKFLEGQIRKNYPDRDGKTQYPGNIFTSGLGPDLNGAGLSTELGIDASQTEHVADIILDVTKQVALVGVVSFRFVKKSKATLAFTKFDTSCAIEFPSTLSDQTKKFFDALWARLEQENINFTFHWGQCNNLNPARVRQKWGDAAVDSWIAARKTILQTPAQRSMFSNKFLIDCGLGDEGGQIA